MSPIRSPALERFEGILKKATEKKASDVHLKSSLPPIVRVNGHLYYLKDEATGKPTRLKTQDVLEMTYSILSDRQKEKFEEGQEVDLGHEMPGFGRFRINLCQQRGRPRLVCRHIPEKIPSSQDLMLPPIVEKLALTQRGLVLVTGATGSGKSTTLAAMIDHITRKRSCHVVTIEDPIEFIFKDRKSIVTQREIGPDTPNFNGALKYALRQDPDVILVGEMRDEETILMALAAAETGHFVLSTLHTVDAGETINRILGVFSGNAQEQVRRQLSTVLTGVISQRLLKKIDGQGRIPALEVLISNRRVQETIADPKRSHNLNEIMEESSAMGMQTFDQSLMFLFQKGHISKEEALEHCSNARDFQLRLQGVLPGEYREESEMESSITFSRQARELMRDAPLPIEIEIGDDDDNPIVEIPKKSGSGKK